MAHYRVWIEKTRKGNFRVRSKDTSGHAESHACIEKAESATINGKLLVGKTLAKAYATKVEEDFHKKKIGSFDLSQDLQALIAKDLETRTILRLSPRTVTHNKMSLQAFTHEMNVKTLGQITPELITQWKEQMSGAGFANETIRGRLGDLEGFLKRLVDAKRLGESPFPRGTLPRKTEKELTYWKIEEFAALDKALEKLGYHETRILCNLAYHAGLRKCEAVGHGEGTRGADMRDLTIPTEENQAPMLYLGPTIVKGGPGGVSNPRAVPVSEDILALLGKRTGLLVKISRCQADHQFQRARKVAGINPKLDIHGLRHSFAKDWVQMGKGALGELKTILGHKSVKALDVYTHFDPKYFWQTITRMSHARAAERAKLRQNDPIKLAPAEDPTHE